MAAGYSLRDAAAALHLSATDLLDAAESAAQPLAELDRFSRQVAELQVLDSRMQALKVLVQVCNETTDLEKKRLAAQAILRFDPWRAPRATGNGGSHAPRGGAGELSPRPRQRQAVTEGAPSAFSSTGSPRHRDCEGNGTARANTAPAAHGGAPARQQDGVPQERVPRSSTPPSPPSAGKPCEPSSTSVAASAPPPPFIHSPAHLFTCSTAQPSTAALAAAAGRAISIFAFLPQPARAPPLRAAA